MTTSRMNNKGFTYLIALMLIMIMGIMLGMVGQSWKTIVKREKEEELIFRGCQIRDAITRWYTPRPGQHQPTPLRDLKDLLQDPRSLTNVRYLRRMYTDPMTGKEWAIINDPNKGIQGVASTSGDKPLKTGGFPDDLQDFIEKQKYSDWKFMYVTPGSKQTGINPQMDGRTGMPSGTPRQGGF